MPNAIAWAYVINGQGNPIVQRSSHTAITVTSTRLGEYEVTLPFKVVGMACVATIGNSIGCITAIPGESAGLSHNKVKVLTLSPDNQLVPLDFSIAMFYTFRFTIWPWPLRRRFAMKR